MELIKHEAQEGLPCPPFAHQDGPRAGLTPPDHSLTAATAPRTGDTVQTPAYCRALHLGQMPPSLLMLRVEVSCMTLIHSPT